MKWMVPSKPPVRGEVPGRPQEHRGVAVVPAAVHLAGMLRDVLEGVALLHRERVEIRAQAHRPIALPALESPDHPRPPETPLDRDPPCAQALGHDVRGAVLLVGELGVAMEIPADLGHVVV